MALSGVVSALARLGGADIALSKTQSSERDSTISMGLVVLSTAVLAAISVAFALFDLLRWSAWLVVLLGLICGIVILNVNRLFVVSMAPGHSTWATVGSVLPRIVVAALLGSVIAIPLMLRIFDAEVQSQMAVDQAQMTRALAELREQDPQRVELDNLTQKIAQYESVLDLTHNTSKVTSNRQWADDQAEADRVLPALRQQRDSIQSYLAAQSRSDADAFTSEGVLPKIQALVHLADQSVVAGAAIALVAALIVVIQLLPVLVKSMLLLQRREVDALDSSRKVNT